MKTCKSYESSRKLWQLRHESHQLKNKPPPNNEMLAPVCAAFNEITPAQTNA